MPDLLETQRAFAAALRNSADLARVSSLFAGDPGVTARRLEVYRGNVLAAAAKALTAVFPVVRQVVGDEFFRGLARLYWEQTPSVSGDLHEYGSTFADFISTFEPASEMPYLADLTRLEWKVHQAYCAAAGPRFDPRDLSKVPANEQGMLRLSLSTDAGIVESSFPIVTIWTIHQPGYKGKFEVDWEKSEPALVARDGNAVMVSTIDAAYLALYLACDRGETLEAALECIQAADPQCDLVKVIAEALASGPLRKLP